MLIQDESTESDYIYKLESNIDDCTEKPRICNGAAIWCRSKRRILYADLYKNNCPAYQISVICKEEISKGWNRLFLMKQLQSAYAGRRWNAPYQSGSYEIQTSLGEVQVKVCDLAAGRRCYPEYSSVR